MMAVRVKSNSHRAQKKCLRIIDANYNRAKEAIRVCEDIARFSLEESRLSYNWKSCRHALTGALLKLPVSYRQIIETRGSDSDVGKAFEISDKRNTEINDVLKANMKRAQEALRVLEEFSKVVAPRQSGRFQKIRFQLYGLEKATYSKI